VLEWPAGRTPAFLLVRRTPTAMNKPRRALRVILLSVAIVLSVVTALLLFFAISRYGCGPGFSMPGDAARDVKAFTDVLASNAAYEGFRVAKVEGHEITVIDRNIDRRKVTEQSSISDRPPKYDPMKYSLLPNVGYKLFDAWEATYARLHPHDWQAKVVDVEIIDKNGGYVANFVSDNCVSP
jgi:hypothetical protein